MIAPTMPPNRVIAERAPWQRCFWRACVYYWTALGSWRQQVCQHCGTTGRSESLNA